MNKSLLAAPLALAFALAFIGCSSDSDSDSAPGSNIGYASPIEDINLAFIAGASTVKLTRSVEFGSGDILIIPTGKTLDLNGYTIGEGVGGIIAADGNIIGGGGDKPWISLTTKQSYFSGNINLADTEGEKAVQLANSGSISAKGAVPAPGGVVLITNLTDTKITDAIKAGSKGVLLGDFKPSAKITIGDDGELYVTGDAELTSTGNVDGGGALTVYGKVTGKVTDTKSNVVSAAAGGFLADIKGANIVLVGGALTAKSLDTDGGIFVGLVNLTDTSATSELTGSFAAGLNGSGAANIVGDVDFGEDGAQIFGKTVVKNAAQLKGNLIVEGVTINDKLTIGGTLTTSGEVKFGSATGSAVPSIVLNPQGGFAIGGVNGKLTADNYTLTGAGSILNSLAAANAGSIITLGGTGITSAGGIAGGTPTLVFGGEDGPTLKFENGQTINGFALNVATGGTITIASGGSLTITNGGSIVAGNAEPKLAGTLGEGKLIVAAISTGELVGGTAHQDSVTAGSIGTVASFIAKDSPFAIIPGGSTATWGISVAGDNAAAGTVITGGSVALFTAP